MRSRNRNLRGPCFCPIPTQGNSAAPQTMDDGLQSTPDSAMDDNKSVHILPTSATLLGFCFVVLTFIQALEVGDRTLIDELVAVTIVIFLTTCILSYLSMRVKQHAALYEKAADIIFLAGLVLLAAASLLVILNIVD